MIIIKYINVKKCNELIVWIYDNDARNTKRMQLNNKPCYP